MENQKNYNLKISTYFFLIFILLNCSKVFGADNFSISNITISNEKYLNQIASNEPNFTWSFDKPLIPYEGNFKLFKISKDEDSLVWETTLTEYAQTHYKLVTPHLLLDGEGYKFQINAKNRENGAASGSLNFRMNSLPESVKILNKPNKIFTSDSIFIKISESKDAEIAMDSIQFQVKISDFNNSINTIIDTIVSQKNDYIFINGKKLAENGKFILFIRSFDGVEYSEWSNQYLFFVNRINEPPANFHLSALGNDEIFQDNPKLKWKKSQDPEHLIGGKILSYKIEISTFQDFTIIHEKGKIDGKEHHFEPQKFENHRKYYWRVIAMDSDSMTTFSNEVGVYYVNQKNSNPPKAKILTPKNNKVLKPESYILWTQRRDPDKWDKLFYKITLFEDEKQITYCDIKESTIDSSYNGLLKDIAVSYDNSVRMKLKYLIKNTKLIEGNKYRIEIETFDSWQGKNITRPPEATFIFDDNINFAPASPIHNFMPDSLIIKTANPILSWDKATDPDINDKLRYEVYISTNPTFHTTRYIQEVSGYDENYVKVNRQLMENKQYFWKVRSIDLLEKKSPWSKLNTFWVNAINESPIGAVELLYPQNYKEFNSETSFWWKRSKDNDPGDRIKYLLELATDKNFNNKIYSYLIPIIGQKAIWPDSEEMPEDALGIFINEHPEVYKLIDNRMYYWRVIALDNENLASPNQTKYPRIVYNIKNDPPDIPAGFIPGNGKIVNSNHPIIRWQHSVDPDFADLTTTLYYQVELSKQKSFPGEDSKIYESSLGDNFIKVPDELSENEKYFFRIMAFDSHDSSSGWSMADSFFVNAKNEAPEMVVEIIPRNSIQIKSNSPVLQWNSVKDPDPDYKPEEITYKVKYIADKWIGHKNEKKKTRYITVENGEISTQLKDLEENDFYSFWIEAIDQQGIKSGWSNVSHFSINTKNENPWGFDLLYPGNGSDSIETKLKFLWAESYDPDPGDAIVYNIYYSEDSLFVNNVEMGSLPGAKQDSIVFDPYTELKQATKYFWKVSAEDKFGAIQWGSNSNNNPFVFYTVGYRKKYNFESNRFVLHDNIPNPFYTNTRINYEVKEYGNVKIAIYNVLGEKVKMLVSHTHSAGVYDVEWDGTDDSGNQVPGGMYLCRMTARGFVKNKKMLLLR